MSLLDDVAVLGLPSWVAVQGPVDAVRELLTDSVMIDYWTEGRSGVINVLISFRRTSSRNTVLRGQNWRPKGVETHCYGDMNRWPRKEDSIWITKHLLSIRGSERHLERLWDRSSPRCCARGEPITLSGPELFDSLALGRTASGLNNNTAATYPPLGSSTLDADSPEFVFIVF